jgi:hypothetical protein
MDLQGDNSCTNQVYKHTSGAVLAPDFFVVLQAVCASCAFLLDCCVHLIWNICKKIVIMLIYNQIVYCYLFCFAGDFAKDADALL